MSPTIGRLPHFPASYITAKFKRNLLGNKCKLVTDYVQIIRGTCSLIILNKRETVNLWFRLVGTYPKWAFRRFVTRKQHI